MTQSLFEFDEIGVWSELKLEIVAKYGSAYTKAFKKSDGLRKYYIDGFSGPGAHFSKTTGATVEGSPARALKVSPSFDGYYFIDLNVEKTDYLRSICGNRSDVYIRTGDCTEILTKELLPKIQYKKYNRALCLLDPYGMHLDWEVMLQAGQSKAVDIFLNFPVMDINRNAIWKNAEKVPVNGVERMTKFWGDESWKQAAYAESAQGGLFGREIVKQGNEQIAAAFRKRLKEVAGFGFVSEPLPMRNSRNAVVYYLFLASQKSGAEKIISDIFKKYR
ncbi:MAG: three-Cys-motif partner protein TcmP [Candidatus Binataceae bacterium]